MKRLGILLVLLLLPCALALGEGEVILTGEDVVMEEAVEARELQYGDDGDDVAELQQRLTDLYYYTGNISGRYREGTRAAIRAFQEDFNLEVTGVADTETQALLFAVLYRPLRYGSSGEDVKRLQTRLTELGYYHGKISGNYLEGTQSGISAFQEKNGLTADGVAGPTTLAKVDAAYNALGSSSSSSASSSSSSGLKLNSTGKEVSALQTDLTTLGYYWAQITGNFGGKTETAVKRFQEENGLTVDGVAGKKTLDAIAAAVAAKGGSSAGSTTSTTGSVLKLNSQGTKVSQLQTDLKQLGYYYAEITGNFGEKTQAAVKEFQKRNGLTADGIAGANTLAAIAAAVEKAGGSVSGSTGSSGSGLKLGSTGKEVGDLQENLTTLGFYYGDITNHFGTLTQTAVKKFQKSRGLTQDGVAGAKTLAAIASAVEGAGSTPAGTTGSALREGDSGSKVTDLQTRLKSLKYYYGDITGNFGTLTKQAVKKFQEANNLTVDGIAGTATLNKLYALTGGGSTSGSSSTGSGSTVTTSDSYGKVTKNNVYLRSSANTSSAAKASLKQGTLLRISKIYTGSDGVKWYYVSVKVGSYTYTGYIRSDMMETITEEEYNKAGGSSINTGDQEVLGMLVVTGTNVRLRYSPSTDAEKVGTANKGDVFYYVDSVSGWYQTKAGYWISKDYARPMTAQEIKDYTGSGDASTTYRYGSTGSAVTFIQTALTKLKYYTAEITGHFGSKTEDAVKRFQKDNGLTADGVVGKTTMDKLNEKYNAISGGGSSDTSFAYNSVIYNPNWALADVRKTITNYGLTKSNSDTGKVMLTDISTGKSFKIHVQSSGSTHVDAEPLTAADTRTMCSIYGVSMASQIPYTRRAMILSLDQGSGVSIQVICSIYGEPHGSQDITTNNFSGQFCMHFRGSTINKGDGGSVPDDENHQAIITKAANALNGKTVNGVTITVKTEF